MEKVKDVADGTPLSMSDFVAPLAPASSFGWTAPLTPAPAFVHAAEVPTDPITVLDELVSRISEVHGAILASVDGFGLLRSTSMADEPSHPAMLAAAVGLAHQLVGIGGGGHLRQLVVDHDAGLMLVWPIGTERVLALLTSTCVDQRHVRMFVHDRVSVLLGLTP